MRLVALLILFYNPVWAVTYDEVKPVFNKRCAECHQHMADKDWGRQENAEGVRVKIRFRVENGSMPPPPMPITKEERDMIIEWTKGASQWIR